MIIQSENHMQIDSPGKVTDRITLLGRRESCVYLEEITARYMEIAPKDFLERDVISIVVGQMLAYLDKQKRKSESQ